MTALFVLALIAGVLTAMERTHRRTTELNPLPDPGHRDADRVRAELAATAGQAPVSS